MYSDKHNDNRLGSQRHNLVTNRLQAQFSKGLWHDHPPACYTDKHSSSCVHQQKQWHIGLHLPGVWQAKNRWMYPFGKCLWAMHSCCACCSPTWGRSRGAVLPECIGTTFCHFFPSGKELEHSLFAQSGWNSYLYFKKVEDSIITTVGVMK